MPPRRPVGILMGVNVRTRRALAFEPNSALRQLLVEALGELGFEVIASEGRTEALQSLSRDPDFDLVMVDLVDRAAAGEAFVSALAALSDAASIPLIFMTDGGSPAALPRRAVCLAKPFDLDELLAAVRASMRAGAEAARAPRDAHDDA